MSRYVVAAVLAMVSVGAAARDPVPVAVAPVERIDLVQRVELTGSLTAPDRARLASQVEGLVAEIGAEAGDEVATDTVLVRLDDALARLDAARSAAAVDEAMARLTEAARRAREAEDLVADRHISPTELAARKAEVEVAEAALASAEAAHRRHLKVLELHTITAPFDAVVISRGVSVGEWVARSTELYEVAGIERLRLEVQVPQHLAVRLSPGTPARARFDALPGTEFDLEVSRIVRAADANTRSFPVLLEVPNADRRLAPGLSARVGFRVDGTSGGRDLVVPRDAVVRHADGSESVWVVERTGREGPAVRSVSVRTKRAVGALVAVDAEGLSIGAEVVTRGNELLRAGQRVTVVGAEG